MGGKYLSKCPDRNRELLGISFCAEGGAVLVKVAGCSLVDLAHQAGTNEFILKKGFKELFGTTVFGFWNDAKMEQAKLLLTEQSMNVGEVSHYIGYKNQRPVQPHLKRSSGVLPSRYKK